MITFLVVNGDLALPDGQAVRLSEIDSLRQRCNTAITMHLGSYAYDLRAGTQRSILDRCDDLPVLATEEVRRALMRVPGIAGVLSVSVKFIRTREQAELEDVVSEWEACGHRLGVIKYTAQARDFEELVSGVVNLS